MADGERLDGVGGFAAILANYIGETVTIFTSSGGQSGAGFTGVILTVNPFFVKLLSRIGPAPGCSLGNSCTGFNPSHGYDPCGCGVGSVLPGNVNGAASAGGWDAVPVYTVGSVTDIPIAAIVSFVHNAV